MIGDIDTGLGRFLGELWGADVTIDSVSAASAGARRSNILFDAVVSGDRRELVATIVPNREMMLNPIEVEAANITFAAAAGMPAPTVVAHCDDDGYVGGPFTITERVDGETLPRQILRMVATDPDLGPTLASQVGEAMARLHLADAGAAHPLVEGPDAGQSPAQRSLALAEEKYEASLQKSPAIALGLSWLRENQPAAPERLSVVHGDLRNGNMIVGPEGLRAALDFEGTHLGDPMEDPAWLCVRMWRFRNDHLEVGGFGERAALKAGYEAAGGSWDDGGFWWWKVLGTLRWGLGLEQQAREHLSGIHHNVIMAASGRRVAELEYDLLMLLRSAYG